MSSTSTTTAGNRIRLPQNEIRCMAHREDLHTNNQELICDKLLLRDEFIICRDGHRHQLGEIVRTLVQNKQINIDELLRVIYSPAEKNAEWYRSQADARTLEFLRPMRSRLRVAPWKFRQDSFENIVEKRPQYELHRANMATLAYINNIAEKIYVPFKLSDEFVNAYNSKSHVRDGYYWFSIIPLNGLDRILEHTPNIDWTTDPKRLSAAIWERGQEVRFGIDGVSADIPSLGELFWSAFLTFFPAALVQFQHDQHQKHGTGSGYPVPLGDRLYALAKALDNALVKVDEQYFVLRSEIERSYKLTVSLEPLGLKNISDIKMYYLIAATE